MPQATHTHCFKQWNILLASLQFYYYALLPYTVLLVWINFCSWPLILCLESFIFKIGWLVCFENDWSFFWAKIGNISKYFAKENILNLKRSVVNLPLRLHILKLIDWWKFHWRCSYFYTAKAACWCTFLFSHHKNPEFQKYNFTTLITSSGKTLFKCRSLKLWDIFFNLRRKRMYVAFNTPTPLQTFLKHCIHEIMKMVVSVLKACVAK